VAPAWNGTCMRILILSLHNSLPLLQPARRRYGLTSSEQESSACCQTSIIHHW
jgi:hypothetical protein